MRATVTAFTIFLAACSNEGAKTDDAKAPPAPAIEAPSLEVIWLAEGFSAPEGVAQAPDGAYFISNVGAEETDGDGYISRVGADGEVLAARFIDNLDGPKGMAVDGGVLYVTDIDQVRTFDATSGAAGAAIAIPDAKYLNDATLWQRDIYVSDSGTGRIWRLAEDGPVLWREGEELSSVNGLLGDGDRLLISTMTSGSLLEATSSGGWRTIAAGMTDADGIGIVPGAAGGGYLVSSWPGEIYLAREGGGVTSILNTRDAGILQNDLTMFGDVVIVPNWEPGTVTAWRVVAN
ncbi:MAG: hypothetical protein AAB227_09295 [Pseudomonadota bacterium]